MSKTITIPSDRGSRVFVTINRHSYVYKAGATETVPDEVAALFESNDYAAITPRRGVSPLEPGEYIALGTDTLPVGTDDAGNLYVPKASIIETVLNNITVEDHTLVIGE